VSRLGRSLAPGNTRYPLYRRLGGPQVPSGQVRKISLSHRDSMPDRPARSSVAIPTELPGPQEPKGTFFKTAFNSNHPLIKNILKKVPMSVWKVFSHLSCTFVQYCWIIWSKNLKSRQWSCEVWRTTDGQTVSLFGRRHTQTSRLGSPLSLDRWEWSGQLSLASVCHRAAIVHREDWSTPL